MNIPSNVKLKNTDLRHFYKKSLRGWLPDETISKKKHGFGLPFGIWLNEHAPLRELSTQSLEDHKARNIVRPAFIQQTLSQHSNVHAAYYGELVWILMMLELWFQQHAPDFAVH